MPCIFMITGVAYQALDCGRGDDSQQRLECSLPEGRTMAGSFFGISLWVGSHSKYTHRRKPASASVRSPFNSLASAASLSCSVVISLSFFASSSTTAPTPEEPPNMVPSTHPVFPCAPSKNARITLRLIFTGSLRSFQARN